MYIHIRYVCSYHYDLCVRVKDDGRPQDVNKVKYTEDIRKLAQIQCLFGRNWPHRRQEQMQLPDSSTENRN